ncbi:MAG TPA: transcriptional activator RfaH [Verrucomicrobiae bacterium]|nr:transcriptional activator RfaH [Verrucomicrobiae bacterium]
MENREAVAVKAGASHGLENFFWYCARTKPKHEHIAAANLRKQLDLETFLPRLKIERATRRRASLTTVEPLFPCYLFVRCVMGESMNEIRHTNGISSLVRFGDRIPVVADSIIEELRKCFSGQETLAVENDFTPGEEILVTGGAFAGMQAQVLRSFPARHRVQILLEILGRSTPVEVDRNFVVQTNHTLANLVPALAVTPVMSA